MTLPEEKTRVVLLGLTILMMAAAKELGLKLTAGCRAARIARGIPLPKFALHTKLLTV